MYVRLTLLNSPSFHVSFFFHGFSQVIHLSYLLRHSSILSGLHPESSEVSIAKALRSCAQDLFEVRIIVTEPSRPYRKKREPAFIGSYELRRKDWSNTRSSASRYYSKRDWEDRTVYLVCGLSSCLSDTPTQTWYVFPRQENIPIRYRTVPLIARFTLSLLIRESFPLLCISPRIQNVTLPPHHQDNPDDQPKCKGFAFVTFAHSEDTETLLRQWPWDRGSQREGEAEDSHGGGGIQVVEEIVEARKFGFRALSKSGWNVLKTEYLAYQKQLLDEAIAHQDVQSNSMPTSDVRARQPDIASSLPTASSSTPVPPTTEPYTSFPIGCLVFVRNIHPDTNKTTLRTLFSEAFRNTAENPQGQTDGLDYVDFIKGIDSVRLFFFLLLLCL